MDPDDECAAGVCDGSGNCAIGNHIWSKRYGDGQDQNVWGIAQDSTGNIIVSGSFAGTLDMGAGAMTSLGATDLYAAKLSSGALTTWHLRFGDAAAQPILRVATGSQGNVYLAATYSGTINFGGGPLTSNGGFPFGDIGLAKLQPNGFHSWSDSYGDGSQQIANAVAVDGQDNIIVVGHYGGTLDFGQPLVPNGFTSEPYVAKLNSSGSYLWATRFGALDVPESATAVAIGPDNSVIACGRFSDSLQFGSIVLTAVSSDDVFVVKLNGTNGSHNWSQRFGTSGAQACNGLATDSQGRIAMTGRADGALDFGGGSLPAGGGGDAFLAVFDAAGNHLWSKRFGDGTEQIGTSVTVDASGNVVLAGTFFGSVDFGGGTLSSAGGRDAFVTKFSPDGELLWSKRLGDSLDQGTLFVSAGSDSSIAVAGNLFGAIDLGGGALVSAGGFDVFVGKLGP